MRTGVVPIVRARILPWEIPAKHPKQSQSQDLTLEKDTLRWCDPIGTRLRFRSRRGRLEGPLHQRDEIVLADALQH